jgi:hypothetical protein
MAPATMTVRALDLGSVRGGRQNYRSMGFDLTRITGRVTGCWIRFGSPETAASVGLGEVERLRSYLAQEPAPVGAASAGRRRLTAVGLALVNQAIGGYLSLDAWGDGAPQAYRADIYLELQTAVSMPARQAA